MNTAFLIERIAKTKTMITTLEDAATGLMTGAIESYQLDTGQSNQRVTKANISQINSVLDSLYNRLAILEARLNGNEVTIGRAAW